MCIHIHIAGENIISTTKIRNNYGAIQLFIFQYCDSNIGLFPIAPCKFITLNPLCILFCISSLLFFDGFLSKVIALPTIAIAIVFLFLALKGDSDKVTFTFR